jgi:hypothetical protein
MPPDERLSIHSTMSAAAMETSLSLKRPTWLKMPPLGRTPPWRQPALSLKRHGV